MSHYTVLVTKTQDKSVDDQLAPFDETLEVPSYDRTCWCVNRVAYDSGFEAAAQQLGWKPADKRDEYARLPEAERTDGRWQSIIAPFKELAMKLEKEHELYQKPNPECDECHGLGTYRSQYNPDSKWDWYNIGGRWTGFFKLKRGAKGELGQPGSFGNKPELDADIALVKDIDWKRTKYLPTYAVLHDGEWHERGEMGWFGMASNEMSEEEWQKLFDRLVASLAPDDEVTVVDCHI